MNISTNFNVMLTDYKTHALVYSCQQIIPQLLKSESAWIFSRTSTLDESVLREVRQFACSKGINVNNFELTDQLCPSS
jgi:hypothetical protein